jgi:hypothetical protein
LVSVPVIAGRLPALPLAASRSINCDDAVTIFAASLGCDGSITRLRNVSVFTTFVCPCTTPSRLTIRLNCFDGSFVAKSTSSRTLLPHAPALFAVAVSTVDPPVAASCKAIAADPAAFAPVPDVVRTT